MLALSAERIEQRADIRCAATDPIANRSLRHRQDWLSLDGRIASRRLRSQTPIAHRSSHNTEEIAIIFTESIQTFTRHSSTDAGDSTALAYEALSEMSEIVSGC